MKSISNLNPTQRNMVAASLEIDGRTDVAAGAIFFNEELSYAKGKPFSTKAIEKDLLEKELAGSVAAKGLDAVVRDLRTPEAIEAAERELSYANSLHNIKAVLTAMTA